MTRKHARGGKRGGSRGGRGRGGGRGGGGRGSGGGGGGAGRGQSWGLSVEDSLELAELMDNVVDRPNQRPNQRPKSAPSAARPKQTPTDIQAALMRRVNGPKFVGSGTLNGNDPPAPRPPPADAAPAWTDDGPRLPGPVRGQRVLVRGKRHQGSPSESAESDSDASSGYQRRVDDYMAQVLKEWDSEDSDGEIARARFASVSLGGNDVQLSRGMDMPDEGPEPNPSPSGSESDEFDLYAQCAPVDAHDAMQLPRKERKMYFKQLAANGGRTPESAAVSRINKIEAQVARLERRLRGLKLAYEGQVNAQRFRCFQLNGPPLRAYLREQNAAIAQLVESRTTGAHIELAYVPGDVRDLVTEMARRYNVSAVTRGSYVNKVTTITVKAGSAVPADYDSLPDAVLSRVIKDALKKGSKRSKARGRDGEDAALTVRPKLPKLNVGIAARDWHHESKKAREFLALAAQPDADPEIAEIVRPLRDLVPASRNEQDLVADAESAGSAHQTAHLHIGTVVGANAPSLDGSNKGHRMLEAMGWKPGRGIGSSEGDTAHVRAVVRRRNQGLGA